MEDDRYSSGHSLLVNNLANFLSIVMLTQLWVGESEKLTYYLVLLVQTSVALVSHADECVAVSLTLHLFLYICIFTTNVNQTEEGKNSFDKAPCICSLIMINVS